MVLEAAAAIAVVASARVSLFMEVVLSGSGVVQWVDRDGSGPSLLFPAVHAEEFPIFFFWDAAQAAAKAGVATRALAETACTLLAMLAT